MFEWHERLSDIDEKDQESLKVLNEEISKNLQKSTEEFSKYLESKDKIKATEAGIKMKFFSKVSLINIFILFIYFNLSFFFYFS